MPPPIIISLGGSLIVPKEGINITFLAKFRDIIKRRLRHGDRFIIICGGGSIARAYQAAGGALGELTRDSLDWLGIHATRLNAHLVRTIFSKDAFPRVVTDPIEGQACKKKILVAAGWKPGCSTDYDAVLQAEVHGVRRMYNLSNTDYVYDSDPLKNKNAKPFTKMTWKELRALVGNQWNPGLHVPFDPIAAKRAEKISMEVIIINGKRLDNFAAALSGQSFIGTVIS